MLTAITPSEFLQKIDACEEWRRRAKGKTWRELFGIVQRLHAAERITHDNPLGVLAGGIGHPDSGWSFVCPRCCPDEYACLLGLPYGAWMDAVRAFLANGPL